MIQCQCKITVPRRSSCDGESISRPICCTCQYEMGDSQCAVHPSCDVCGLPLTAWPGYHDRGMRCPGHANECQRALLPSRRWTITIHLADSVVHSSVNATTAAQAIAAAMSLAGVLDHEVDRIECKGTYRTKTRLREEFGRRVSQ